MRVYVSERQGGKTTHVIEWLLDGHSIEQYPGWSRAIVCSNTSQVVHLTNLLRQRPPYLLATYLARTKNFSEQMTERTFADLRKAIWSVDSFDVRGAAEIEIAVDNADLMLERFLHVRLSYITMTGELDDPRYVESRRLDLGEDR